MQLSKNVIIAIAIASIVVVSASIAIPMALKQDAVKEPAPGWYCWEPEVVTAKYAFMSSTPSIVTQLKAFHNVAYGDLETPVIPSGGIPAKYLIQYDSKVLNSNYGSGGVKVVNEYDLANTEERNIETVILEKPGAVMCYAGSVVDTIYHILCYENKEKLYSSESSKSEKALWNLVVGGSDSATTKFEERFGLRVPDSVVRMGADSSKMDTAKLSTECERICNEHGSLVVFMFAPSKSITADMLNTLKEIERNTKTTFVFIKAGSIGEALSNVEMIGAILDKYETSKKVTENAQKDVYAVKKSVEKHKAENPSKKIKVYFETSSGKAVGSNTIVQVLFDILGWENIAASVSGYVVFGDEKVVKAAPDIICFYDTDKRTMDEKMRVTA